MIIFLIFLIVLFWGYKYPKSEKVALIISAILWALYALNTYTPDYSGYKNMYDWIVGYLNQDGTFSWSIYGEPGWTIVMLIPALLNLSFVGCKILIATVYILLLYFTVKKYTDNVALALAIFTVFPFIHSVGAMRFGFAAIVFAFFAASLATGNRDWKAIVLYFLGTAMGGSIHYSILILSLLFLAYFTLNKKVFVLLITFTVITVVVSSTDILHDLLISINLPHLTHLAETWLTHQSSPGRLSLSMFGSTYALEMYVAIMSAKICPSSSLANFVKKMYIISLAFIPFVLITDQFTRLYFAMFPLCICSAVNTVDVLKDTNHEGMTLKKTVTSPYIMILPVAALHLFFSNFVYMGTTSDVFYFMSQNYLFNIFNA